MLRCGGVLLLVSAVGFVFDYLLVQEGVRRSDILIVSNALTGVVAAAFFYYLAGYERERRRMVRQRLNTIAEMNHHIRNALQVISYPASSQKRDDSVGMIRRSFERIEWSARSASRLRYRRRRTFGPRRAAGDPERLLENGAPGGGLMYRTSRPLAPSPSPPLPRDSAVVRWFQANAKDESKFLIFRPPRPRRRLRLPSMAC